MLYILGYNRLGNEYMYQGKYGNDYIIDIGVGGICKDF